jgi:ribonuclease D
MKPVEPLTINFIERSDDLVLLAARLAKEERLAVDSEADSFHHYNEKVCLLQISTHRETFLLDLLRLNELAPLRPLFADQAIEKVLHGADYDVRMLARDHGVVFDRLFDTMIAAQLLGLPEWGLASLLSRYFGVALSKKLQKANWSHRPLAKEMIRYAAEDTAYLLPLRDLLGDQLQQRGRLGWLLEECQLLAKNRAGPRTPPSCFKIKGANRINPQQLAVLQALLEFREEVAREMDRPPFKVVGNDVLLDLAVCQPIEPSDLRSTRGLSQSVRVRYGAELISAIHRGQVMPPHQWPTRPPTTRLPWEPAQEERLRRLKAVRDRHAASLQLSPGLLCSNAVMERLVRLPAPTLEEVAHHLTRWRFSILGNDFLAVL